MHLEAGPEPVIDRKQNLNNLVGLFYTVSDLLCVFGTLGVVLSFLRSEFLSF